jgi:hypothetical protein
MGEDVAQAAARALRDDAWEALCAQRTIGCLSGFLMLNEEAIGRLRRIRQEIAVIERNLAPGQAARNRLQIALVDIDAALECLLAGKPAGAVLKFTHRKRQAALSG